MNSNRRNEIIKEIDRLEELMSDIVLSKKTDYVNRNKNRLHKLRNILKKEDNK